MASSLNVIALISGGKDSLFSILHCQANGHSVVALANLHPAPSANDDEDINSYMYQTVGHSVIPLYEQALGLPLYRQEITGTAVDSSRDYATPSQKQEQDETEDLVPLLTKVMDAHPEANAVSTGAILSTYQRTRVESVALRLGLTPLSYLWQYPLLPPYTQSSLLHDMTAVGQEAIIIKTASGGLDQDFLGLDVASQKTIARLAKAMGRYGDAGDGAILGEGGEFETLALNGPKSLWKKRIRIENGPPAPLDGGQAVLKIKASILEEKTGESDEAAGPLRIPELFDDEFASILKVAIPSEGEKSSVSGDAAQDGELSSRASAVDVPVVERLPRNMFSETRTVFTYSNVTSDTHSTSSISSPSRQLIKAFLRLEHILQQRCLSKASVNHCTLLLRDMADFTVLNPIYAQYFSDVNPPARATIAVGNTMPEGLDVMLSVIIDKDGVDQTGEIAKSIKRQGLHVQGRSYWAPANIGPYSQAISARLPPVDESSNNNSSSGAGGGEIVYVAGQIPLVPASMAIYKDGDFKGQAVLSLQHLWRIGRTKHVKWWSAAVAFIPASQHPEEHVRTALQMWKAIHTPLSSSSSVEGEDGEDEDEEVDIDPWDRLNTHDGSAFNDTTYRSPLPDRSAVSPDPSSRQKVPMPPCFVAQVSSLPRGVDVEWCASGLTSTSIRTMRSPDEPYRTTTWPQDTRTRFFTFEIRGKGDLGTLQASAVQSGVSSWTNATLYVGREFTCNEKDDATLKGVQWIPCQRVWGEDGEEVKAVLVGRVDDDE